MASLINSTTGSMPNKALMPMFKGRPDPVLQDAMKKLTPQQITKAKATDRFRIDVPELDVLADDDRPEG